MKQWAAMTARNSAARRFAGPGLALGITACAMAEVDTPLRPRSDAGDAGVTPEADASSDAQDVATSVDVSVFDQFTADSEPSDSGSSDSGADQVIQDAVTDAVRDAIMDSITGPCQTPLGVCTATLPVGWTLVQLQPNRSAACPADFTQQDVISNPVAGTGACDCSCTANSASACNMGQLQTRYGTTTACSSAGAMINVNGAGCTMLSGNFSTYFSATPLSAGASCTPSTVTERMRVTSNQLRSCEPPAACREDVCNGRVPPGSSACIGRDGDHPCPAGWTTRSLVGTDFSLTCSSCTCQGSANCTNARINFFSDPNCATALISFAVDGTCQPTNGVGAIGSFTYAATAGNPMCTANGPRTATVALTGTRTLCCK
jgi:hypothetical protein